MNFYWSRLVWVQKWTLIYAFDPNCVLILPPLWWSSRWHCWAPSGGWGSWGSRSCGKASSPPLLGGSAWSDDKNKHRVRFIQTLIKYWYVPHSDAVKIWELFGQTVFEISHPYVRNLWRHKLFCFCWTNPNLRSLVWMNTSLWRDKPWTLEGDTSKAVCPIVLKWFMYHHGAHIYIIQKKWRRTGVLRLITTDLGSAWLILLTGATSTTGQPWSTMF